MPGPSANTFPLVYALGSNGSGQLGVGHCEDVVGRPQKCMFNRGGRGQDDNDGDGDGRHITDGKTKSVGQVHKIVAGGNHTLLLTTDGRLFTAGTTHGFENGNGGDTFEFQEQNLSGFLSLSSYGHEGGHDDEPETETKITDVAATWEASFVVVNGKAVYACGAGSKGELGLGPNVTSQRGLTKVFDTDNSIKAIVASMAHVVVLLSNGHVWGWGGCRKGQLGEGFKTEKIL